MTNTNHKLAEILYKVFKEYVGITLTFLGKNSTHLNHHASSTEDSVFVLMQTNFTWESFFLKALKLSDSTPNQSKLHHKTGLKVEELLQLTIVFMSAHLFASLRCILKQKAPQWGQYSVTSSKSCT